MTFAKKQQDKYPQFEESKGPITERAIWYALEERDVKHGQNFIMHEKIDNIAFNKRKKHEVDLVLTSRNGEKLFVEIKGEMTYLEVNKLQYLLGLRRHFYILQLTEIDWIEPYDENVYGSKYQKSKKDFYDQIDELVKFVNGEETGEHLKQKSIERLEKWINYRSNDIERWKALGQKRNPM